MKELKEILARIDEVDGAAALATVVDVKGSSYRLPGAKMLVLPGGSFVGTVSGGCVEADVLERASNVIESGRPQIFLYDTTGGDESVFSLNMGCKGVVRVLLEPVSAGSRYLEFLRACMEGQAPGFVSSALEEEDGVQRSFFDSSGRKISGDPPSEVEEAVKRHASSRPGGQRPCEIVTDASGTDHFVEYISPPQELLILGAGADAMPLADIARRIGWRVSVYDHRPAYANRERFPDADAVMVGRPEALAGNVPVSAGAAAVIMSHNFDNDKQYLAAMLASEIAYVGALGPKVRTRELLEMLVKDGFEPSAEALGKLHAPVGLDTGAADPESIAVAIIAEIQASLSGREGGPLKHREGPIYDR